MGAVAAEKPGNEMIVLENAVLQKAMRISQPVKKLALPGSVGIIASSEGKSALYQQNLQWDAANFKQIVFSVRTTKSGRLRFSCNMVGNGKTQGFNLSHETCPDGEFHDYAFDLTSSPKFQGVMTNYELRWFGEEGEIVVNKVRTSADPVNAVPSGVVTLWGNALKRALRMAKPLKEQTLPDAVGMIAWANGKSAFHQQNLDWDTANFKQIVFTVKTAKPGRLRFSGNTLADGKRQDFALYLDADSDGEFHDYAFDLVSSPKFQGVLTNYELRWFGEEGEVAVKKIRTSAERAKPAPPEAAAAKPQAVTRSNFRKGELKGQVAVSRGKLLSASDALEARFTDSIRGGAFYQQNLAWDTAKIKQIEFSLKTDTPGYFSFGIAAVSPDGGRTTVGGAPLAAIPDGEYHSYIFNLGENANWRGTATNWEVRWNGDPANAGINAVLTSPVFNHIPDATALTAGREVVIKPLKPRAKCVLHWENGVSPGVTLRFYDRDLKELPGTVVTLKSGEKSVEFTTPEMMIETRVTLNQTGDGFPAVRQLAYVAPSDAGNLTWRGQWLWSQNKPGPIHRSIWFERVIELDGAPEAAAISFCGDDKCLTYVNGKFIGQTGRWSEVRCVDIASYLKKGINRISCRVKNIDSWGGFIADVYVRTASGEIFADTDSQWRCDAESNTDTTIPSITGAPVVLGAFDINPWRGGMEFRYVGPRGELEPVKLEPGAMTVRVLRLPASPITRFRFITVDEGGKKLDFSLPVTPGADHWKVGETITLRYNPPYVDKGVAKLYLDDDMVAITGNPVLAELTNQALKPPALRQASFIGGGRPMLKLGDEIIQPVFLHVPSAYGRDRVGPVQFWSRNNIRSYRIAASFLDYWTADGQYDFSAFDREVARLLSTVPDAVFAIHLYACMPGWWLARNPDDLSRHENGNPRDLWLDLQTWGSQKWLTDSEAPIKALIDHVKSSNFADRVWGVSFADSRCGEWFWTSTDATGKRSNAGYAPADYAAFRAMLKEKYQTDEALAKAWAMPGVKIADAPMPDLERARKGSVGTLLNPGKDMQLIDCFEFRSLALAKALIHFGKITKRETDGKWLVGAYYGYFSEMIANGRRNIQSNGHNGFVETAKSPYVDFVHAPLRYAVRRTGQPGTMMQLWDTYLLHGKMVYVEQDVRTSYAPREEVPGNKMYCGTPDSALCDIGQFYRSFGMTVATGTLNYWYDLNMKQFDERAVNEAITSLNDVYMKLGPVKGTTPFEVAVVSDRDSVYYSQYPAANTPNTIASEAIFKHFNKLAVPFKSLCISDLLDTAITVQPFKLYIMLPTLMLTQEQRQQLMARFEREKATVIWLYAAGPFYPTQGPSAGNNADFLGIQTRMAVEEKCLAMTTTPEYGSISCENGHATSPLFYPTGGFDSIVGKDAAEQPLMVSKKIGGSTHYYTALTDLPMTLYAAIMGKIGVWRYSSEVGTDQYWIGNDVLFLHAATNGEKTLRLPENMVAQAIVGPFQGTLRNGESFTARSGMTYGFLIVK